jgi:hypothetical protein
MVNRQMSASRANSGRLDKDAIDIDKSVELLHALLRSAKRMAVLTSSNPIHPRAYEAAEAAGKALALVAVRISAPTSADLEQTFEEMIQEKSAMRSLSLRTRSGRPSFRWGRLAIVTNVAARCGVRGSA